jgi:hypothetical protein
MRYLVVFLLFSFIISVASDQHLNDDGPFGKLHLVSELLSPYNCNYTADVSSSNAAQIILNVTTTVYSNNEQINVTWTSTSTPCADDFIGIYSIEIPLSLVCDYFDYEFVKNRQHLTSWTMINLRRPLEFRYYSRDRNCSGNYLFIGKSVVIQPLNYNEPIHIHLAYSDRIDQMFVSYLTNSSQYIPQCQYGLDPSSLQFQKSACNNSNKCNMSITYW